MQSSLLAVLALAFAEPQDPRGELEVDATAVAVAPSGDLWIGTGDGRVFVSRDWNQSWSEIRIGPHADPSGEEQSADIRFFDAERAILAGYQGLEGRNEILRTTDGGRTWVRVSLGPHGLTVHVTDAQVFADGHAWLAGSTGVLVSQDFGASWQPVASEPFEGAARCCSVCFSTPELGVVGADGNALSHTTDGGRTWTSLATPLDELYPAEASEPEERPPSVEGARARSARRVDGVWCLGQRWLVLQRRQLFQRPIGEEGAGEGKWSAIDLRRRGVVAAAFDSDRLLVVTDDLRLSWVSSALAVYAACNASLERIPIDLACGARGAAFASDSHGRVCTLENLMLACARMQPGDGEARWPIVALDRTADGTLFGISKSALYRSRDSGRSWERIGEAPYLYLFDVCASADGSHAFVKDGRGLLTWREGRGLTPLFSETAPSLGFEVRARRANLWIATGFETAKDEETQDMLTSSDTVLVGPGFKALVLASTDEGSSWNRIDEYEGAIAAAAWLGNDDVLRLCMSDGTIRTGKIDARDGTIAGGALALLPSDGRRFGADWGTWIAFPDAQNGWIGGNGFFGGNSLMRTLDGGRTWSAIEPTTREVTRAFRLGGGACVRVVGFWQPGCRVELWRAGEFQEIRRFEPGANDARVDAGGCLLVRLTDGEVWSLAADGDEWSLVGTIPVPAR